MVRATRQQYAQNEPAPGAELPSASPESTNQNEVLPPAPPQRGEGEDFFEWMESLDCWDKIWLYIYRLEPAVLNAPGEDAYLRPRYAKPITRDEIAEKHGGGKYRIILNWKPLKRAFAKHEFGIEGEPIFLDGQTLKDTGRPARNTDASAGSSGNSAAEIVNALREIVLRPDVTQDKVIEALTDANKKAVELVAAAGKKQIEGASQPTADPVDTFVKMAETLQRLTPQPQAVDPFAMLDRVLSVAEKLQGKSAGSSGVSGFVDEFKQAFGERMVDSVFNGGGGDGPGWKATAAQAGLKLVESLPLMLDRLVTLQRTVAAQPRVLNGTVTAVQQVQPALPAQPEQPASTQAADVNTLTGAAAPASTEADLTALQDAALKLVVECFERDEDGEDAVMILSHVAVPVLPELAQRMGQYPLDTIIWWLKGQPQFSPYKDHPRMEEFVGEFRDALLRWAEAQKETPANANA